MAVSPEAAILLSPQLVADPRWQLVLRPQSPPLCALREAVSLDTPLGSAGYTNMISRPTLDERVNSPAFPETALSEVVEEAPRPGPITRMHPLTLRFTGELEDEFADQYFTMTLTQVRFALVLGVVLYTVFGILDTMVAPGQRQTLWLIRYAFVVPALLAGFACICKSALCQCRETV